MAISVKRGNQNICSGLPYLILLSRALLLVSLFSFECHADTITGVIRRSGPSDSVLLDVDGAQNLLQVNAKFEVYQFLSHLRSGDQITVQGNVTTDQRHLVIQSVDRVGLQELIGMWHSATWEIYNFLDFSSLDLYLPSNPRSTASVVRHESLKYVVTPTGGERYSIFMCDNQNVSLGFLEVSASRLTLTVTDPQTGQPGEKISLSPLRFP